MVSSGHPGLAVYVSGDRLGPDSFSQGPDPGNGGKSELLYRNPDFVRLGASHRYLGWLRRDGRDLVGVIHHRLRANYRLVLRSKRGCS